MEIRSDEESFCIHCVLDIFQSGYMCKNKTDPFQTKQKTQLNRNEPWVLIYDNNIAQKSRFPQFSGISVWKNWSESPSG